MTLLITVFAAVTVTLIWYISEKARRMMTGPLCLAFWGASLMWLVDAVMEYIDSGAEFFSPSGKDMLNDAFLGISVVALALTVWVIALLVRDPGGVVRKRLKKHD